MFLVFAYDDYDANGGLRDCRAVCTTRDEAEEKAEGMLSVFAQVHILDVTTATVYYDESSYIERSLVISHIWKVTSLAEFAKS